MQDINNLSKYLLKTNTTMKIIALLLLTCTFLACTNQYSPTTTSTKAISIKNGVSCGFLDSKGTLWLGSNTDGLYAYDGNSFTQYTKAEGVNNNKITAIIEDKSGHLWLGTIDGVHRYDYNAFHFIPIPFSDTSSSWLDMVYPIINPNEVKSLAQDHKGNIWIGTCGAGAYCYDGKNFRSYLTQIGHKQIDSLHHNWIPSITTDNSKNVWLASMTHGGVSRYDGESFTHYMPKDGLSDDMVRKIYVDRSGTIWFGFNGNRKSALTSFSDNSFTNYNHKDGLCHKSIIAMHEDKSGQLWLGGDQGPLCVFNGTTFEEFVSKDGQTFQGILTILEDSKGNIWWGGKDGLWQYDGDIVRDMTL